MIKKVILMFVWVALMALPALAQTFGTQKAEQPNAAFQSTSTMSGSGSSYSANPMLNTDGTATYDGAGTTASQAPIGPRKAKNAIDPTDEALVPLGDAVLPLLLMSLAFCGYLYLRRRKTVKG